MSKTPTVNDFPDSGLSTEEARQLARSERTVFKPPSRIEHLPMLGDRIQVWFEGGHGWKVGTVEGTWANLDVQVRYANGLLCCDKLAYPWRLHNPMKRRPSDAAASADAESLMGDTEDDARRTSKRSKADHHSATIYGQEVVGRHVSTLFSNGHWYDARIASFEHRASGDKVHMLRYDDKERWEVQFHTLLPAKWRFVDNPAPPRSSRGARRRARPQAETLAGASALVGLAAAAAGAVDASAPSAAGEVDASAPSAAGEEVASAPSAAGEVDASAPSAAGAVDASAPSAAGEEVASAPSAAGEEVASAPSAAGAVDASAPSAAGEEVASAPSAAGEEVASAPSAAGEEVASAPSAAGEEVASAPSAAGEEVASGAGAPTVPSVVVSVLAAAGEAASGEGALTLPSAASGAGALTALSAASGAGALTAPSGVPLQRDHGGASFSSSCATVAASVVPPSQPTHAAYLQFLVRKLDEEIGTLPNLAQQVGKAMALLGMSPGKNFVENIAKLKEEVPFEEL